MSAFLPSIEALGETAGTVVSVSGTALVRSEKSGGSKALKTGDKVSEGDVINTPSNGQVKLLLKDKTILDIGASALFHVRKFSANGGADRQVDVSMMYGSVRAAVTQPIKGKGSFKVRTASATMGVRGTEFVVKSNMPDLKTLSAVIANPEKPPVPPAGTNPPTAGDKQAAASKTEVTVVQGKVDVEPPKPKSDGRSPAKAPEVVSLTAGKQLTTSTSEAAPAKPVTLDANQLKSVQASAKVEDNTFKKAIVIDVSNNSSGNSSGGSSGGPSGGSSNNGASVSGAGSGGGVANITAQIVSETIAAPPINIAPPVSAANAGFAGTFSTQNIFNAPSPVNLTAGGFRKLRVILTR